jgi:hypothetical protein
MNSLIADFLKYEIYQTIESTEYFKQELVSITITPASESTCSRKCGLGGVQTILTGLVAEEVSCVVNTCTECIDNEETDGDECELWANLSLCVDTWIANKCPVLCCIS